MKDMFRSVICVTIAAILFGALAIAIQAQSAGWNYLDLWDAIPPQYFLDASLHLGAEGERLLIEQITPALQSMGCNPTP